MLTLQDLKNKNVVSTIQGLYVKEGTTKDGNNYNYLDLMFKNGWHTRIFLNDDQRFGFLNACETVKSDSLEGSEDVSIEEKSNLPF